MFKVNLHDYHYELKKIEIQKRVMKAITIIFGSLALTGIVLLSEQMKADSLGEEIKQLEKPKFRTKNRSYLIIYSSPICLCSDLLDSFYYWLKTPQNFI